MYENKSLLIPLLNIQINCSNKYYFPNNILYNDNIAISSMHKKYFYIYAFIHEYFKCIV